MGNFDGHPRPTQRLFKTSESTDDSDESLNEGVPYFSYLYKDKLQMELVAPQNQAVVVVA